MTTPARPSYAERQRQLVAALTSQVAPPPGFDARQVQTARQALLAKRAHELAYVWPILTASLGPRLVALFGEFAADRPTQGLRRDGHDFAAWLEERQQLPLAGALEWAQEKLFWHFPADGSAPQRDLRRIKVVKFPGGHMVRVGRRVFTRGRPRTS